MESHDVESDQVVQLDDADCIEQCMKPIFLHSEITSK